ncbi:MAG: uracil-DNA glycosylase family protein [Phycisphaerales bacterium]
MTAEGKKLALLDLARKRQQATWPRERERGHLNLSDAEFYGGRFECDYVSPYSRCAGNVTSDILVFLQDWTSNAPKKECELCDMAKYGRTPSRITNKKLDRLLETHLKRSIEQVYATNLFPFIKRGSMSQGIYLKDLSRAAAEFALPHIKILRPKLVIVLGMASWNAISRCAIGLGSAGTLASAIESPYPYAGALLWCQAHPAGRAKNRSLMAVENDWNRMAHWYKTGEIND